MPSAEINGGEVVYEVIGDDRGIPVALTPGGRASREFVRPLGEGVAAGGMKVLLWDRPNSGASDVQFSDRWPSESHMHADTLQRLVKHLGWGPTVIAGGSAGARVSIITAMEYPEVTRQLFVWHIAGGIYPSLSLACGYILGNISAAKGGGMESVIELPEWKERITQNPRNRERFLSMPAGEFVRILKVWLSAYVPMPGQVIPGVPDASFGRITAPTEIIRSGANDEEHPLLTCYEVHALIRGSRLLEPPWAEDAWEQAFRRSNRTGGPQAFDLTAEVAPLIIDFCRKAVGVR
jgi:2-hydroxy-6-oxonona-2,4-dienedioate hydrolase